jgi:hypothetical protein
MDSEMALNPEATTRQSETEIDPHTPNDQEVFLPSGLFVQ